MNTHLPAPTKEELLAAFEQTVNKRPGFTPQRFKGYCGYGNAVDNQGKDWNNCGCAITALYVAADCPYGDPNDAENIDNWMNHTYGPKVRFGITCGFDGGDFTDSCDRTAYDAAREVGLHFFPPADMAHATAL